MKTIFLPLIVTAVLALVLSSTSAGTNTYVPKLSFGRGVNCPIPGVVHPGSKYLGAYVIPIFNQSSDSLAGLVVQTTLPVGVKVIGGFPKVKTGRRVAVQVLGRINAGLGVAANVSVRWPKELPSNLGATVRVLYQGRLALHGGCKLKRSAIMLKPAQSQ